MIIVAMVVGLVAALLLTPVAKAVAPLIGAIDRPGELKVHEKPMPRFGGSAIWAGTLIACAVGLALAGPSVDLRKLGLVLAGATVLAVLGAVDDAVAISARARFGLGLVVALGTSVAVLYPTNPGVGGLALAFVAALWLLGCAHAMNMLDGLDGLAAGVAAIVALGIAAVAWLAGSPTCALLNLGLAGACLGFLRYNFHPASTFMGDVGSLFLGFSLASSVLLLGIGHPRLPALLGVVLAVTAPVGDMLLAILRRLINHRPIFDGDRGHFYDQLRDRFGFGAVKTVLTVYALSLAFVVLGLCVSLLPWWQALLAAILVVAVAVAAAITGGFIRREPARP
jgi:UDP-GlcNAc:undecaprenyl-phosphate/decaprenyl-phosphate GlcNAc-1-phosphate transferase